MCVLLFIYFPDFCASLVIGHMGRGGANGGGAYGGASGGGNGGSGCGGYGNDGMPEGSPPGSPRRGVSMGMRECGC